MVSSISSIGAFSTAGLTIRFSFLNRHPLQRRLSEYRGRKSQRGYPAMTWWKRWFKTGKATTLVDYSRLGSQLVRLLGETLKSESADALEKLARACEPSADEGKIASEVLYFHRFLLVQACAGAFPQSVTNRVVSEFNVALRESSSRLQIDSDTFAEMERLWVTRAHQYDEPFAGDLEQYLEKPPGHLPWKRTIARFSQNFRDAHDSLDIFETHTSPSVQASIAVAITFGSLFKSVGEAIRSHFDQSS